MKKQLKGTQPATVEPVALVLALSRAAVVPFDSNDWGGYCGAMGQAHMVYFNPQDVVRVYFMVGIDHWPQDQVVVILDDGGLTFNYSDENMGAYQVVVGLSVTTEDSELPEPKAYMVSRIVRRQQGNQVVDVELSAAESVCDDNSGAVEFAVFLCRYNDQTGELEDRVEEGRFVSMVSANQYVSRNSQ